MRFSTMRSTMLESIRSSTSRRNSRICASIRPEYASPRLTENSGSAPVMTTASGNTDWHQSRTGLSFDTPPVRNSSSGMVSPIFCRTAWRLSMNAWLNDLPFNCRAPLFSTRSAMAWSSRRVSFTSSSESMRTVRVHSRSAQKASSAKYCSFSRRAANSQ